MKMPARRLLVIGSLALVALPAAGRQQRLVVEDITTGKQLGEATATVTAFPVDDGVIFAGPQERRAHHMTVIATPTEPDGVPYPVKQGGWMTPPLDLKPGQGIVMVAQDLDGHELFRLNVQPDAKGEFRPAFGPDWTHYVPVDD